MNMIPYILRSNAVSKRLDQYFYIILYIWVIDSDMISMDPMGTLMILDHRIRSVWRLVLCNLQSTEEWSIGISGTRILLNGSRTNREINWCKGTAVRRVVTEMSFLYSVITKLA